MKLVIVSGFSGSGKSIALSTLEDCGFYCVDNLPVTLIGAFAKQLSRSNLGSFTKAAISIDSRNQSEGLLNFAETLNQIETHGVQKEILFLQSDHDALIKRFSETRRKHPLTDSDHSLLEAIQLEQKLLEPVAASATLLIDTTHTNIHQLREIIRVRIGEKKDHILSLFFESFGFKHGIPLDADFIYDVRCLPNPHWEATLRPLTGRDQPVAEFLDAVPEVKKYCQDIKGFIHRWAPHFEAENRSYLTVAIGCTGGQHRSVYLAESLAAHFRTTHYQVMVRHRELG